MDNKTRLNQITVTAEIESKLLETVIKLIPSKPQSKLKSLLKHRCIAVDGFTTSQFDYPIRKGAVITINGVSGTVSNAKLPFEIIHEDDEIIVINKIGRAHV